MENSLVKQMREQEVLQLLTQNSTAYLQVLNCQSIEEVLASPNVQLSTIKNKLSENIALSTIALLIREIIESINIPFNMKAEQVIPAARMLYSEFWMLKLEDFKLCFQNGIKGKYNESNFVRLDVQVLISWLQKYLAERNEVIENISSDQQKYFNNIYEQIKHPKMLELLKTISERSDKEKPLKNDISAERIKAGQEKMKEFDKIYIEQFATGILQKHLKESSQRFIKVGDKFLNQNEYLEFKCATE